MSLLLDHLRLTTKRPLQSARKLCDLWRKKRVLLQGKAPASKGYRPYVHETSYLLAFAWLQVTRSARGPGGPRADRVTCNHAKANSNLSSAQGRYLACFTRSRYEHKMRSTVLHFNLSVRRCHVLTAKATEQLFSKVWTKSWTNSEPMNVLQEGQPSSDVRRGQLAAWHRNSKDKKPRTHGGFR